MTPKTSKHTSKLILCGLIATSASLAFVASSAAQDNSISSHPFSIDGQFDALGTGEWSDVTPAEFISLPGATATPVALGNPAANSALYAALGRTQGSQEISLHLLYDFLPRTNRNVFPGEVVASVTFPVHLPNDPDPNNRTSVSVIFQGHQNVAQAGGAALGGNFFDVLVDLNADGVGDVTAASLGLTGAAGFGQTPLSLAEGAPDHLIVELGVSLRIPAGFATPGGPLPGGGINPATGLYDPDPAFWGAAGGVGGALGAAGGATGELLQPASAASFTINHDGSIGVTPVPEPASTALLLAGLGFIGARRRK